MNSLSLERKRYNLIIPKNRPILTANSIYKKLYLCHDHRCDPVFRTCFLLEEKQDCMLRTAIKLSITKGSSLSYYNMQKSELCQAKPINPLVRREDPLQTYQRWRVLSYEKRNAKNKPLGPFHDHLESLQAFSLQSESFYHSLW